MLDKRHRFRNTVATLSRAGSARGTGEERATGPEMATLIRFEDYRHHGASAKGANGKHIYFNRQELFQLLDLYSRRVMSGEWRDYAIDQQADRAVFSIFRRSTETPLFVIVKTSAGKGRRRYVLQSGPRKLEQSHQLSDIIAALEKRLRVVWIDG
jgi:hypothetical protein